MRKWLILALCAGIAVAALLVWFAVQDARQAAAFDARIREAESRSLRLQGRLERLGRDGAPEGEMAQAAGDRDEARQEVETLHREQRRREESWPACLFYETRRHLAR